MKKHFFEYYDTLEDKDKKAIFENCLFVFDTNVILNLYRYTPETRDKMIEIMEKYKDRIWMPYQVGWEYFNNREAVIKEVSNACHAIQTHISNDKNSLFKVLDEKYKRHPYVVKEDIKKLVEDSLKPLLEKIDGLKSNDPNYIEEDIISDKLTELFDNRVGEDYSPLDLDSIYSEGEIRYKHSIPPGYEDIKTKKDRSPRHLYGDLIVWKQTIDIASAQGVDIVFISDDQKEDWYEHTAKKEPKRPRRELIKEFGLNTGGKQILLYNQDGFLHYIKEYLGDSVDESTISEVVAVAEQQAELIAEKRRRIEAFMKRYVSSFEHSLEGEMSIDAPFGRVALNASALSDLYETKPFPHIDYVDVSNLIGIPKLVPEAVASTIKSAKSFQDFMTSSSVQSVTEKLIKGESGYTDRIGEFRKYFNTEEIEKANNWLNNQ